MLPDSERVCSLCGEAGPVGWVIRQRESPWPGPDGEPVIDDYAAQCPDPDGVHLAARVARLSEISGLLPEELALTLDDVAAMGGSDTAGMLALARDFVADPWGLFTVWGGYGNGKTLILQAVVNEMREAGWEGAYVKLKDLLDHIRAGNAKNAGEDARQRYERFRSLPLLAIDECDAVKVTDWVQEFWRSFVDDRYRLGLCLEAHTVLAMNCDPAQLGGDIYDRLRDGRFIIYHNADASMRPAMPARVHLEPLR